MFKSIKKNGISLLLMIGVFTTAIDASVPNAPGTYIGATGVDKNSVRISFLDNSDDELGFKVFGDGIDVVIPANDETVNTYVYENITGLTCNEMYTVEVMAYNNDGNSTLSDKRSFNTHTTFGFECVDDNVSTTVPPNAPGSYLGVTGLDSSSVRVSFLDNSDKELGFRVFGDGIDIILPANDETVKSYVYGNIRGLTCDKVYSLQAVAFNAQGVSSPSDTRAFNIHSSFGITCDANRVPIANAGIDKNVVEGVTVPLNGSASSDADFDVLTYNWSFVSKPAGSVATFNDENAVNPTFDADVNGTYLVQLVVNDGQVNSIADTMSVIVTENNLPPQAPVAIAGENLTVTSNSLILIDGSNSYDPDGTIVRYDWSLYGFPLNDTPSFSFSAPVGTYKITLTVTDDDGLTATDNLTITVEP